MIPEMGNGSHIKGAVPFLLIRQVPCDLFGIICCGITTPRKLLITRRAISKREPFFLVLGTSIGTHTRTGCLAIVSLFVCVSQHFVFSEARAFPLGLPRKIYQNAYEGRVPYSCSSVCV